MEPQVACQQFPAAPPPITAIEMQPLAGGWTALSDTPGQRPSLPHHGTHVPLLLARLQLTRSSVSHARTPLCSTSTGKLYCEFVVAVLVESVDIVATLVTLTGCRLQQGWRYGAPFVSKL